MIDFSAFIDENGEVADPCGLAKQLHTAELNILAGGGEQKIEFRDRAVWYQPHNLEALKATRVQMQRLCQEKNGTTGPRRRFAITAGALRGNLYR
jgi:hypothetical protein